MSVTPTETRRTRPAPRVRSLEVAMAVRLSPNMVRVSFMSDDFDEFAIKGPTGHIKLYLPQAGQEDIDFVALAAPRGARPSSAPIVRTFTPRRFDAETGRLDVDFFLHGDGPASTFAASAKPGDRAALSGPARPYIIHEERFQLVGGDETALPAIAMIVETLPTDAEGAVILELGDPRDAADLVKRAGVAVEILTRSPSAAAGQAMLAAIRRAEIGSRPVQAWVAGESVAIRAVRAALLERGVARESLTTRGYWRHGEAGHPDHDMGED